MSAMTLPGVEAGIWQVRHRFDKAAAAIMDKHYSREVVGSPQVGGPGYILVMVTPCERAVWITKRHDSATKAPRAISDGFTGYRCAAFRNQGAGLSSMLILEAMRITEMLWGRSSAGWLTYVDTRHVKSSNPGYCFKQAGWWLDREWSHRYLIRLRAEQEQKP